ncbi:tyrosine-type recombinase/integrase [Desulfurobacterium sp.]|uniref:tyrosine-type recombinase/integrase n=1 Tax=Desulfurobacterium sp. TaxID=2004706 RepID=UPI0026229AB1|nr:tyrosine-type recombinase/integrase [Desulfurobacterium sp.]
MKIPFKAVYDMWVKVLQDSKSPKTVVKYKNYLRGLVERLGEFAIEEINDKKTYIIGYAVATLNGKTARKNFYNSWNSFKRFVKDYYNIDLFELPKDFKGKNTVKKPNPLKEEHFQALKQVVCSLPDRETNRERNISLKLVFYLMGYAGLRLGEALLVREEDLFFKTDETGKEYVKVLIHGKGNKERTVPIFKQEVVDYLKKFKDYLPPNLTHQAVNHRLKYLYRKAVVQILKENPENFYPHRLRDTYLTRLADRKIDIRVLQELAGHSSIEMTRRYLGVSQEQMLKEIQKVDF